MCGCKVKPGLFKSPDFSVSNVFIQTNSYQQFVLCNYLESYRNQPPRMVTKFMSLKTFSLIGKRGLCIGQVQMRQMAGCGMPGMPVGGPKHMLASGFSLHLSNQVPVTESMLAS